MRRSAGRASRQIQRAVGRAAEVQVGREGQHAGRRPEFRHGIRRRPASRPDRRCPTSGSVGPMLSEPEPEHPASSEASDRGVRRQYGCSCRRLRQCEGRGRVSSRKFKGCALQKMTNTLRIIGGEWRGRRIRFPGKGGIRPTPDRVRETLFNWLMAQVPGSRCLDLFAGSGALGLEALSRGAAHATFVERDRENVAQPARYHGTARARRDRPSSRRTRSPGSQAAAAVRHRLPRSAVCGRPPRGSDAAPRSARLARAGCLHLRGDAREGRRARAAGGLAAAPVRARGGRRLSSRPATASGSGT